MIKTTTLRRFRIPIYLAICAAGLYGLSVWVEGRHDATPIRYPFQLAPGLSRSPEFSVTGEWRYGIYLEVERGMPIEELLGLLGVPSGTDGNTNSVLHLDWAVFEDGKAIEQGTVDDSRGAWEGLSARLGVFHAERDKTYVIEIDSHRDAAALAVANPQIVVRIHIADRQGDFLLASLLSSASWLLAIVAAIWMAAALVRRMRDKSFRVEDGDS